MQIFWSKNKNVRLSTIEENLSKKLLNGNSDLHRQQQSACIRKGSPKIVLEGNLKLAKTKVVEQKHLRAFRKIWSKTEIIDKPTLFQLTCIVAVFDVPVSPTSTTGLLMDTIKFNNQVVRVVSIVGTSIWLYFISGLWTYFGTIWLHGSQAFASRSKW